MEDPNRPAGTVSHPCNSCRSACVLAGGEEEELIMPVVFLLRQCFPLGKVSPLAYIAKDSERGAVLPARVQKRKLHDRHSAVARDVWRLQSCRYSIKFIIVSWTQAGKHHSLSLDETVSAFFSMHACTCMWLLVLTLRICVSGGGMKEFGAELSWKLAAWGCS